MPQYNEQFFNVHLLKRSYKYLLQTEFTLICKLSILCVYLLYILNGEPTCYHFVVINIF